MWNWTQWLHSFLEQFLDLTQVLSQFQILLELFRNKTDIYKSSEILDYCCWPTLTQQQQQWVSEWCHSGRKTRIVGRRRRRWTTNQDWSTSNTWWVFLRYFVFLNSLLIKAQESPEPIYDLVDCGLKTLPTGVFSKCKVLRKEVLLLQVFDYYEWGMSGLISLTAGQWVDLSE